ncbi:MAG: SHOCT domain-containing protein [Pseudomonadales bacterium]
MSEESRACSSCGRANPVQAKFCAGCRASLVAAPNPPPPNPLPPPMPPRGPYANGFGGKSESRQFDGVDAQALYAAVARHVEAQKGGEIRNQMPPHQMNAILIYKEFLSTMSAPVRVESDIAVSPVSAAQTMVSISSRVDWSSTASIWIISAVVLVLVIMLNPYMMMLWFLLFIGGAALNVWMIASRAPKLVAENLFTALRSVPAGGSAGTYSPAMPTPAPQAQAAPPAATPATPSAVAVSQDETIARIRKLAELKDIGAITVEEFEAKKAELLARI